MILSALQFALKLIWPELAPKGFTTIFLAIAFFGSINLLGIAVIGEYIAKIFEEVKARPLYIRKSIVKNGQVTAFNENSISSS